MPRYIFVQPQGWHSATSVVVTDSAYLIEVPDGIDPHIVNVDSAADDTRLAIIPLIENLQYEDYGEKDYVAIDSLAKEVGLPEGSTWEQVAWAYRGLWYSETGEDPSEGI